MAAAVDQPTKGQHVLLIPVAVQVVETPVQAVLLLAAVAARVVPVAEAVEAVVAVADNR